MNLTWQTANTPILYEDAILYMENYVNSIIQNQQPNMVLLLEHYDVYTKGTSAVDHELINANNIPIIQSNRGGKFTYHGLGQRIIYPMINLAHLKDIKKYVSTLETWIINTLQSYNLDAFKKEDLVGIWVLDNGQEKKIGALGIRVKKWVAYHGISINIAPDLTKFQGIVPCGISTLGVTSLQQLKKDISFNNFDSMLKKNTPTMFINKA